MPKYKPQVEKSQIAAFRKAARELDADENEGRFKETLRALAKHELAPMPKRKSTSRTAGERRRGATLADPKFPSP
jgi:hypothetical protein